VVIVAATLPATIQQSFEQPRSIVPQFPESASTTSRSSRRSPKHWGIHNFSTNDLLAGSQRMPASKTNFISSAMFPPNLPKAVHTLKVKVESRWHQRARA